MNRGVSMFIIVGGGKYEQGCVYIYNSGGGGSMNRGVSIFIIVGGGGIEYEQGCVYVYNSGGGGGII